MNFKAPLLLYLYRCVSFLYFFSVLSLKTIFVGTSCLNLIVFIPVEHLRNKYFGQRKGIEPAILRVSISSLVSPYRMGNCVCMLHHFKLTAFHLMGRIIHRWRNRLQKACVTADVRKLINTIRKAYAIVWKLRLKVDSFHLKLPNIIVHIFWWLASHLEFAYPTEV